MSGPGRLLRDASLRDAPQDDGDSSIAPLTRYCHHCEERSDGAINSSILRRQLWTASVEFGGGVKGVERAGGVGHVKRTRDPDDERQVRVRLTERGRALREKARDIPGCILDASNLEFDELLRLRASTTSAPGTTPTSRNVRRSVAIRGKADIEQAQEARFLGAPPHE